MLWANANGVRSAPLSGLTGACPACSEPVIAKCGAQRIHHWAHLGKRTCDHWWESETQWHRAWKQHFPDDWHEVALQDAKGERHVADVRTSQRLTIEFQHSYLQEEERRAREAFYRDLVWVIDGHRLPSDWTRFGAGAKRLRCIKSDRIFVHQQPETLFPRNWTRRKAPVIFDFGVEQSLWCLLPQHARSYAVVLKYSRQEFVLAAKEDSQILLGRALQAQVDQWLAAHKRRSVQRSRYGRL